MSDGLSPPSGERMALLTWVLRSQAFRRLPDPGVRTWVCILGDMPSEFQTRNPHLTGTHPRLWPLHDVEAEEQSSIFLK